MRAAGGPQKLRFTVVACTEEDAVCEGSAIVVHSCVSEDMLV